MKTLNSQRVQITPLRKQDFSEIIEMYLEPDSNKYIRPLQTKSEEEFLKFLQKKLQTNRSLEGLGFWTCRLHETGKFIGTGNLNPFFETDRIQLGCHLKSEFWNQGFAFEVLQALLEYGTSTLHLPIIYGFFEVENIGSQKLLKKLGFEFLAIENHFDIDLQVHSYTISNGKLPN